MTVGFRCRLFAKSLVVLCKCIFLYYAVLIWLLSDQDSIEKKKKVTLFEIWLTSSFSLVCTVHGAVLLHTLVIRSSSYFQFHLWKQNVSGFIFACITDSPSIIFWNITPCYYYVCIIAYTISFQHISLWQLTERKLTFKSNGIWGALQLFLKRSQVDPGRLHIKHLIRRCPV